MRLYLDNCCFNRQFDKQLSVRIRIETEAKLSIQNQIRHGQHELVWSYILDYENNANHYREKSFAIALWRDHAIVDIGESEDIVKKANAIRNLGVKSKDALHIACAIQGLCQHFLTTDDTLLKVNADIQDIAIISPVQFITETEEYL